MNFTYIHYPIPPSIHLQEQVFSTDYRGWCKSHSFIPITIVPSSLFHLDEWNVEIRRKWFPPKILVRIFCENELQIGQITNWNMRYVSSNTSFSPFSFWIEFSMELIVCKESNWRKWMIDSVSSKSYFLYFYRICQANPLKWFTNDVKILL